MPQIDLTWNLFLTAVAIPALAWYLRRLINRNDKANDDRHTAIIKLFDENREDHSRVFECITDHEHRISYLEGKTNGAKRSAM